MSNLASLNVKINRDVKLEADSIANALGMTLSTAINIFVRQMVSEKAIPFRVQLADSETEQFHKLLNDIRAEAAKRSFISDDEINAEIAESRNELPVKPIVESAEPTRPTKAKARK